MICRASRPGRTSRCGCPRGWCATFRCGTTRPNAGATASPCWVGDLVEGSPPRNNFPLAAAAERHLLIAGGIGITPIMAMIAELRRRRAEFRLHYCTRSPEETAFLDDLAVLAAQGLVQLHHDGGDPAKGLDIVAALQECRPGTHLYYCGPAGMMAAAAAASAHWPLGTVHCEYFAGPNAVPPWMPE